MSTDPTIGERSLQASHRQHLRVIPYGVQMNTSVTLLPCVIVISLLYIVLAKLSFSDWLGSVGATIVGGLVGLAVGYVCWNALILPWHGARILRRVEREYGPKTAAALYALCDPSQPLDHKGINLHQLAKEQGEL